jgi:hypothetical protein
VTLHSVKCETKGAGVKGEADNYMKTKFTIDTLHLKLLGTRGRIAVEVLCGFETRRGERIFSIYLILPASLNPGVYSAPKTNEYQKQKNKVSAEQRAAGA